MGSLNADGIPVVSKDNRTFRKRDVNITAESSSDDTITNIVTTPHTRAIGSGSIVRDDGTVDLFEELVWGVTRMGRTTTQRVASDADAVRSVVVKLHPSGTEAVIPTSLQPDTPQLTMRHTGTRIVHSQSVGDTVIERISDSGVYDQS